MDTDVPRGASWLIPVVLTCVFGVILVRMLGFQLQACDVVKKKDHRLHRTKILSTRLSEGGCAQGGYSEVRVMRSIIIFQPKLTEHKN